MGENSSDSLEILTGNRTDGDGVRVRDLSEGLLAFKVFNITVVSLALVILTVTAITCSFSYHKRSRQYRRARAYENTVKYNGSGSPIYITSMRRALTIQNPLVLTRKPESSKHKPQVYFIYDNPIMTEEESEDREGGEEEKEEQMATKNKILSDVKASGILLNPCVFYV
ncbi:uncharacterized protein O3C94_022776 [Discoglossus pictus]